MKIEKKVKIAFIAAFAVISGSYGIGASHKLAMWSDLTLYNVESLAACESIGWWDNNGNCVKNDQNVYFCKSDSWPALTDCTQ